MIKIGFKDKLKDAAGKAASDITKNVKDTHKAISGLAQNVADAGNGVVSSIEEIIMDIGDIISLTGVAAGTGAISVAQIALQLGSLNENKDLFLETLSKKCWRGEKKGDNQFLQRNVDIWWKSMKGRKYTYNAEDSNRVTNNTDTEIKYFFKGDDGKTVRNKPITVIKEDGEWKVEGITP